jgi:hypothetical protein
MKRLNIYYVTSTIRDDLCLAQRLRLRQLSNLVLLSFSTSSGIHRGENLMR